MNPPASRLNHTPPRRFRAVQRQDALRYVLKSSVARGLNLRRFEAPPEVGPAPALRGAAGKSAALSLTLGKKEAELTIKMRWRQRDYSTTDPVRRELVLLKRFKAGALGDAVQGASDFARLLGDPGNLKGVVEKLRENDPEAAVGDKRPLRELADFHHDALQQLIDVGRPSFY